jgi:hypothetical protein
MAARRAVGHQRVRQGGRCHPQTPPAGLRPRRPMVRKAGEGGAPAANGQESGEGKPDRMRRRTHLSKAAQELTVLDTLPD